VIEERSRRSDLRDDRPPLPKDIFNTNTTSCQVGVGEYAQPKRPFRERTSSRNRAGDDAVSELMGQANISVSPRRTAPRKPVRTLLQGPLVTRDVSRKIPPRQQEVNAERAGGDSRAPSSVFCVYP